MYAESRDSPDLTEGQPTGSIVIEEGLDIRRTPRAELYDRLLTADPPVCGLGKPVAVLQGCERRRRDQECLCRLDANEVSDDLLRLGCDDLADYLVAGSEPEDVEDFVGAMADCLARSIARRPPDGAGDREEATERLRRVERRLRVLVEHEAGLTDRYSDEIDP